MSEPGNPEGVRGWAREAGIALGVGLLAGVAALRDLLGAPGARFVGDWQTDAAVPTQWAIDWIGRRVAHAAPFGRTSAAFAPVGYDPLALADGAAMALPAPFVAVLGWPLGANVFVLVLLALNVTAGAWLARATGVGRFSSLLAGLALGVSPFVLTELTQGRLEGACIAPLVAALAAWLRLIDAPDLRKAWTFAAWAGVTTLLYAWYGAFLGWAVLTLAIVAARRGALAFSALRGPVGVAAVGALACAVPGVLLAAGGDASAAERRVPEPLSLDYSLPLNWLFGTGGSASVPAAVSFVLLVLAVWAVLSRRASRTPWMTAGIPMVGLVGWAFSLGPRMVVNGGPIVDSHLPFYVLFSVPFSSFVFPHQASVLVQAAVAVLAAAGVDDLSRRICALPSWLLPLLAIVAAPIELSVRGVPLEPRVGHLAAPPTWLAGVQALAPGSLLTLPLTPELRVTQQSLLLQRVSGHPAVEGPSPWLDRVRPKAWDTFVEQSTFLRELVRFERGQEVKGEPERANYFRYAVGDVDTLVERGVRWVLISESNYTDPLKPLSRAERQLFEELCGKPAFSSEGVRVYDLQSHSADGDVEAPPWRMPEGVRGGDGTRRMAGRHPTSEFIERAAPARPEEAPPR